MKRESFVFYRSFFEAIEKLKKNDKLTVYSHLCRYALGEEVGELDGVPGAIFDLIKPQIDANFQRYENGSKGGRPKTKTKPKQNRTETETEPNVNVNVNENVNVNDNVNVNVSGSENTDADNTHTERDSDTQTTDRPSNIAIARTILEEGYPMDAADVQAFVEYNDKLGWKKPLEEALKLWNERKFKGVAKQKPFKNKFQNFERNHDNDELAKKIIQMQLGGNA